MCGWWPAILMQLGFAASGTAVPPQSPATPDSDPIPRRWPVPKSLKKRKPNDVNMVVLLALMDL